MEEEDTPLNGGLYVYDLVGAEDMARIQKERKEMDEFFNAELAFSERFRSLLHDWWNFYGNKLQAEDGKLRMAFENPGATPPPPGLLTATYIAECQHNRSTVSCEWLARMDSIALVLKAATPRATMPLRQVGINFGAYGEVIAGLLCWQNGERDVITSHDPSEVPARMLDTIRWKWIMQEKEADLPSLVPAPDEPLFGLTDQEQPHEN